MPGATSPFDPEQSPTQATAFWLGRDIVRGVFEPLERLKVDLLSRFYRVGHGPVREAILLLSTSGLVVHEPQRGYRVAPVSLADFNDVIDLYYKIYKLALTMAIERGDDAWEEMVILQYYRSLKVRKVLPDGEPEEREMWQRSYAGFHRSVLAGCGSAQLLRYYDELRGRLERYVNLFADLESDRERDHHSEHRAIVDVLVARDRERLLPMIERYFAIAEPIRASIVTALERYEAQESKAQVRRPAAAAQPAVLPAARKGKKDRFAKKRTRTSAAP